jgi:preprotein translocase subunit SecA
MTRSWPPAPVVTWGNLATIATLIAAVTGGGAYVRDGINTDAQRNVAETQRVLNEQRAAIHAQYVRRDELDALQKQLDEMLAILRAVHDQQDACATESKRVHRKR